MRRFLPYDPGCLPTAPCPKPGDEISLSVDGMPPRKAPGRSLRNPKHSQYQAFVDLRKAAAAAMNGRAWYFGGIALDLTIYCPQPLHWSITNEYLGGVMDTLDGSSGAHFTYLPVVYEDDSQVAHAQTRWTESRAARYTLGIRFL